MKPTPLALAITLAAAPAVSMAQILEEVVVTAQKRSESLQEVAVSITAIGGDILQAMGMRTTTDLAQITPNMSIQSDRPGNSFPSIRGIGTPIKGPGVDQGVAIYLDGVQVDSAGANQFSVMDLQQVEVLKGPQGTLYGRNAVGGVINMTSRKPSDEFEGYVRAGVGDFNAWEVGASVEGPLIEDKLSGRISGMVLENDGYFENRVPGVDDLGDSEDVIVRGTLLWTPTDSLEVTFSGDYSETKTSGPAWRSIGINNHQANAAILGGIVAPVFREPDNDKHKLSHNLDSLSESEIYGGSVTIDYALSETIDLISITGYRESEQDLLEDLDGSPNDYLHVASQNAFENLTQEFRLHYTDDSLKGVVGFYYTDSDTSNIFSVDAFAEFLTAPGGAGAGQPTTTDRGGETEAWSLFTQWDWDITDSLTLIVGARYSDSQKETFRSDTTFTELQAINDATGVDRCFTLAPGLTPAQQPACLTAVVPASTTAIASDGEWSSFTPKLGLRYIFENDTMVYASYSQGFRDGGISGSALEFREFDEEIVDAYELGFKSEMAEGTVRFNGSVFLYDYTDLQLELSDFADGQVVTTVFNAGEAEMYGAEFEFTWLATEYFTLSANLGLLETEITELEAGPTVDFGNIREGNEFPHAPGLSASVIPVFNFDLLGGTVMWRTEINYVDEYFDDAENGGFASASDAGSLTGSAIVENGFAFDPSLVVMPGDLVDDEVYEAHTVVNTSFVYTTGDGNLDISLWARNLLDEEYEESRRYVSGVIYTENRYALPRTYGVRAEYRF